MSSAFYTGGHSLADLIRELYQLHRSLSAVQDVLAELLVSGEIVPLEEITPGWYLEWASVRESGEGWARLGGRKIIVIVIDGKQRDPAKIRYRRSEPRPPIPSEPAAPDPPLPATEDDGPPASGAASLPPGHWHVLAVVLDGWRQGGLAVPLVQEYFARLTESGAIKLSEALPEVWMMGAEQFGGRVTGKKHFSFVAPGGKQLWADEIGCQLSDSRILDPRQLHLFLASEVSGVLQGIEEQAIPPTPGSPRDRALAQLVEELKQDQAAGKTKAVSEYKAGLRSAGLTVRDANDIWREAKASPGVKKIKMGRRARKN